MKFKELRAMLDKHSDLRIKEMFGLVESSNREDSITVDTTEERLWIWLRRQNATWMENWLAQQTIQTSVEVEKQILVRKNLQKIHWKITFRKIENSVKKSDRLL